MRGPIFQFLADDHERLDRLLGGAVALVPTPTPEIAAEIRKILGPHNEVEEGEGGLYDECDAVLSAEAGPQIR